MAKVVLPSVASGFNPATINSNFQVIADQLNNRVLYRTNVGSEPNQMLNLLDMNNFKIINLPTPSSATEPMRKKDGDDLKIEVQGYTNEAKLYAQRAENYANIAISAAGQASASASQVIIEGNKLKAELIKTGAEIAEDAFRASTQAQGHAANAAQSAVNALDSEDKVKGYAKDATDAAVLSQAISDSLAAGTIGFDAWAYDFGMVADPVTYFNRDFGMI